VLGVFSHDDDAQRFEMGDLQLSSNHTVYHGRAGKTTPACFAMPFDTKRDRFTKTGSG